MQKQLDNQWKRIDKFEGNVNGYAETKATWCHKGGKEGALV
jgi:hypothetical protein